MNDGTRYYPTTMIRLTLTPAEKRIVDAAVARLERIERERAARRERKAVDRAIFKFVRSAAKAVGKAKRRPCVA